MIPVGPDVYLPTHFAWKLLLPVALLFFGIYLGYGNSTALAFASDPVFELSFPLSVPAVLEQCIQLRSPMAWRVMLCSGSTQGYRLIASQSDGCTAAARSRVWSNDKETVTSNISLAIGPDELGLTLEGELELLAPVQRHLGNCSYEFLLRVGSPGTFVAHLMQLRENWEGLYEKGLQDTKVSSCLRLIGTPILGEAGRGVQGVDAVLPTNDRAAAHFGQSMPPCKNGLEASSGRWVHTAPVDPTAGSQRIRPGRDWPYGVGRLWSNGSDASLVWRPWGCSLP